jgi:hypothetical protein
MASRSSIPRIPSSIQGLRLPPESPRFEPEERDDPGSVDRPPELLGLDRGSTRAGGLLRRESVCGEAFSCAAFSFLLSILAGGREAGVDSRGAGVALRFMLDWPVAGRRPE